MKEELRIIKREELKERLKKHTRSINFYETLIAITMSIYGLCDDMSYVNKENVLFVFLAYMLFSMTKLKIVEKLIGHIANKYVIKSKLAENPEYFEWKYKILKKYEK